MIKRNFLTVKLLVIIVFLFFLSFDSLKAIDSDSYVAESKNIIGKVNGAYDSIKNTSIKFQNGNINISWNLTNKSYKLKEILICDSYYAANHACYTAFHKTGESDLYVGTKSETIERYRNKNGILKTALYGGTYKRFSFVLIGDKKKEYRVFTNDFLIESENTTINNIKFLPTYSFDDIFNALKAEVSSDGVKVYYDLSKFQKSGTFEYVSILNSSFSIIKCKQKNYNCSISNKNEIDRYDNIGFDKGNNFVNSKTFSKDFFIKKFELEDNMYNHNISLSATLDFSIHNEGKSANDGHKTSMIINTHFFMFEKGSKVTSKVDSDKAMSDEKIDAAAQELTKFNRDVVKRKTAGETTNKKVGKIDVGDFCDSGLKKLISKYLGYIQFLVPFGLMILITIDYLKAMASNDQNLITKATNNSIKRTIAGLLILLLPTILTLIFNLFGLSEYICF